MRPGPPSGCEARSERCATLAETVESAELIVEAIIEQPEAKRRLFTEIDGLALEGAVAFASNTSHLESLSRSCPSGGNPAR